MEKKNNYYWQQFVNYIPLVSGAALMGLCLVALHMYTPPFYKDWQYYLLIVVSYMIGAILVWSNFYIHSKNKANYIFIALAVLGILFFSFFNRIIPTRDALKLTFNPGFKGAFCIIGGVNGYPPLEKKDNILYVHIPDSGVVYTSTYCDVKSFETIEKDSSVFVGRHYVSSPCPENGWRYLNYSGFYIDKKEVVIYMDNNNPIYMFEGGEFKGDLAFESYLKDKYHVLGTPQRLQQLYTKGAIQCSSGSENLLDEDHPFILTLSIVMLINIIGLLPLYFFWHNKRGKKAVLIFITFAVFVFILSVFVVSVMYGLSGVGFAAFISILALVIGFILFVVSLISWIRFKRKNQCIL